MAAAYPGFLEHPEVRLKLKSNTEAPVACAFAAGAGKVGYIRPAQSSISFFT